MKQWEPSVYFKAFRLLTRVQIVLGFVIFLYNFLSNHLGLEILVYFGWVVGAIGLVFNVLGLQELGKKGEAPMGKSFVDTTVLVDTGPYAVVRHPIYLGGALVVFGSVLISQHWLTLIFGALLLGWVPIIILKADKELVEKFGDDYERYMRKVPSVNFLLGIIRLQRGKRRRKT